MAGKNIDVPSQEEQEAFYKGKAKSEKKKKGKKGRGVVIEDAPTIVEVGAQTVKEEAAPIFEEEAAPTIAEPEETEVADEDIQEVDENGEGVSKSGRKGKPEGQKLEFKSKRVGIDKYGRAKLTEDLGEEDVLARMVEELNKDMQQEIAIADVERMLNAGEEEIDDTLLGEGFEEEFGGREEVRTAIEELSLLDEGAVERMVSGVDTLVDNTDKLALAKRAEESKIWDTELGRQRVESLTKFAKDSLGKAGKSLKNLFSGPIKNGLLSFGRTMQELGYGAVSVGENLPKTAMKKMEEGLKTISEDAIKAYEVLTVLYPAEIKRTKEKISAWEKLKKEQFARAKEVATEQKERQEYERLKQQEIRLRELKAKFGE